MKSKYIGKGIRKNKNEINQMSKYFSSIVEKLCCVACVKVSFFFFLSVLLNNFLDYLAQK